MEVSGIIDNIFNVLINEWDLTWFFIRAMWFLSISHQAIRMWALWKRFSWRVFIEKSFTCPHRRAWPRMRHLFERVRMINYETNFWKIDVETIRSIFRFKSKYMLESHKQVHVPKKFKCDLCGNVYSRKASLIKHMDVHSISNTRVPCDLCNKIFPSKREMEFHRRIHTGTKRFG